MFNATEEGTEPQAPTEGLFAFVVGTNLVAFTLVTFFLHRWTDSPVTIVAAVVAFPIWMLGVRINLAKDGMNPATAACIVVALVCLGFAAAPGFTTRAPVESDNGSTYSDQELEDVDGDADVPDDYSDQDDGTMNREEACDAVGAAAAANGGTELGEEFSRSYAEHC